MLTAHCTPMQRRIFRLKRRNRLERTSYDFEQYPTGGGKTPSTLKFTNGSSSSGQIYVNNEEIYDAVTDIPYADEYNVTFEANPVTIDINNKTAYTIRIDGTNVGPGGFYTSSSNVDIEAVTSGTSSGAICYSYDGTTEREVAYAQGAILSTYLNGTLIISGDDTWSDSDYNISVSGAECIIESKGAVYVSGQLILVYVVV